MAEQIKEFSPAASFNYELYEGDPDHLRTVDATPPQPSSYIDPASLKFKYRIGHGLFGDVWLATHHQTASDYEEHHEVAVKKLHPMKDGKIKEFLSKFEELWVNLKSRKFQGVCWLHGVSVISNQICIALKSYEGSVGDRMARLKGGKLLLPDVLRYGIELAKSIQELHRIDILVLNLKPTNFLLDENDHTVLGDFGIPYLLLNTSMPDSELTFRVGTPNYMAPEQWEPGVRGPISYETDSWGLGCSIIEMLTGTEPWFGKSVEEIYQAVVINREKPQVPCGLPPGVEDGLKGCFEYDFYNRPVMRDIIQAFESSQKVVSIDGSWSATANIPSVYKSRCSNYSTWFLSKYPLKIGDTVRSRKALDTCKPQTLPITEGTVVGLEKDTNRDGFILVQIPNMHNNLSVHESTLERVTYGFAVGDWVRLVEDNKIGILHTLKRDGSVSVGFLGHETLWLGRLSEIKLVEPFFIGQFVRLKANIDTPQFEWPHKRGEAWASGRISRILPNGCLEVKFPGRFVLGGKYDFCLANPDEIEVVSFDTCHGILQKYEHVEDFHWGVRPLVLAFGLFTSLRLGIFIGKKVGVRLSKRKEVQVQNGVGNEEAKGSGSSAWLPTKMANILFKEGKPIANSW